MNTGPVKEVSIGLDISTRTIGVCVLEHHTQKLIHLDYIKLSKFDNEYDKADNVSWSWIKPEWKVKNIYIEEAAKKFSPGFSSAGTIMTLGRFNGIVSYEVYKKTGVKPVMVQVRSARKILGVKIDTKDKSKSTKEKVFEIVHTRNPKFPWYQRLSKAGKHKGNMIYDEVCQDMADAWIICKGGQLLIP